MLISRPIHWTFGTLPTEEGWYLFVYDEDQCDQVYWTAGSEEFMDHGWLRKNVICWAPVPHYDIRSVIKKEFERKHSA